MPRRTRPLVLIHASSQRAASVHELLVAKGFSVLEAPTDDFLDVFMEFRPDMVLLELQDRDQVTKELARRIRDTELGQVVPVILFGDSPGPNPVDIVSMGADQFAPLPLDEEWLQKKLDRLRGAGPDAGGWQRGLAGGEDRKKAPPAPQDDARRADSSKDAGMEQAPKPPQGEAPGKEHTPSTSDVSLGTDLGIFGREETEEKPESVLGAISDVLSPGDLGKDQDINLDDLDVETTIPGLANQVTPVMEEETGESDLDIAEDTDQDQGWKDSRTGPIDDLDSILESHPKEPPVKPSSLGAVSLPPWQVSTGSSPTSGAMTASERPGGDEAPAPSPFDPTHLAEIPSSTEVITDGHPATPEQDTVVGLKWKTQERRLAKSGKKEVRSDKGSMQAEQGGTRAEQAPKSPRAEGPGGSAGEPVTAVDRIEGPRGEARRAGRGPESSDWLPKPPREFPTLPVSLDEQRPLDLFTAMASQGADLAVSVRNETLAVEIAFRLEEGFVTAASCAHQDMGFIPWLVRRSLVPETEVARLQGELEAGQDRLFSSLLDKGLLTGTQLQQTYESWMAWLFYEAAGWRSGQMDRTEADRVHSPVRTRLGWPGLICEAVRRKYGSSLVMTLVGGAEAKRTWRSEEAMRIALGLPDLSYSETRALTLLSEGFPLGECARRTDLEASDLAALVHGMDLLGILTEPTEQMQAKPTQEDTLGSPQAQGARIEAKLEQVREGDYYALLGVRPTASLREIRAANEQVRRSFEDEALAEEVRTKYGKELDLIRKVLDEAVAVLTHPRYAVLYAEAFLKKRK